jgi:putative endonuclease
MTHTAHQTGLVAETLCRWVLRLKGYRILAARYKSPLGEIDIIALRGKTVAMVEVKARPTFDQALEAISPRQRQRLQRATMEWLARHPQLAQHDVRFDAMLAAPWRWPRHITNAWQAD